VITHETALKMLEAKDCAVRALLFKVEPLDD